MLEYFDGYELSDSRSLIDREFVHFELKKSYWAEDIPRNVVDLAIDNSICFGIYRDGKQIAFARVISDRATFAYLCDVIVTTQYRGNGLGKWMISSIKKYDDLQGLRRWMLATRDAHKLYEQFGFEPISHPERLMQIVNPDMYKT